MYTRCPSCRSEIAFEPPANMDSLPEGYKHRITCPCCGVTIGVKLNKPVADVQATFTPQNPYATNSEPVYNAGTAESYNPDSIKEKKKAKDKAFADKNKKAGTIRNIFMLIFSLLLIAVNVLAYLKIEVPYCNGFENFNGIGVFESLINDFEAFKESFASDLISGIFALLPAIIFVFAGISALVALIALFGKKYGRAFNFIWSLIVLAAAVVFLFAPVIAGSPVLEYFSGLVIEQQAYGVLIVVGIALLQFIFALFFCKSMKKKK